jgi:hypothetical protein
MEWPVRLSTQVVSTDQIRYALRVAIARIPSELQTVHAHILIGTITIAATPASFIAVNIGCT